MHSQHQMPQRHRWIFAALFAAPAARTGTTCAMRETRRTEPIPNDGPNGQDRSRIGPEVQLAHRQKLPGGVKCRSDRRGRAPKAA